MIAQTFEIRVAVVGYVSVGKSTVLNALLGDKFSEVSMKRTTAGVNFFRITQKGVNDASKNRKDIDDEGKRGGTNSVSLDSLDRPKKTAQTTHDEIAKDNQILRSSNSVHEKTFDIEVDDAICEMRDDTQLVLVDIPGINEADSNKKYKEYVESKWNTFDCVIVVMDAIQGVNTQEQVELLKFVQTNNLTKKKVPTIILGNKMDEPDDEEKLALVHETREEVIKIFGPTCSEASLLTLIAAVKNTKRIAGTTNDGAWFIPVSAMNAFIYRKASHVTLQGFQKFDMDVVDRIGRAEVGRKWKRLSDKQKVEVIRGAISDPAEYKERLEGTNFENFLVVLCFIIGGKDAQSNLLSKQIDVSLTFLGSQKNESFSTTLHNVFKKCTAVGRSPKDLPLHFWRVYKTLRDKAMQDAKENPNPQSFARPFAQLEEYFTLAGLLQWNGEQETARRQIKSLLQSQLSLVNDMMGSWSFDGFAWCVCTGCNSYQQIGYYCSNCENEIPPVWENHKDLRWNSLSPHDWITLLSSILLPSNEMEFYESFGEAKCKLDATLTFLRVTFNSEAQFSSLQQLPTGGEEYIAAIRNQEHRDALLKVKMPDKLSDPSHWGHISWKYVTFCRSIERQTQEVHAANICNSPV